jgi:GntR family transcriptional regulator / MocR family aminotransferase
VIKRAAGWYIQGQAWDVSDTRPWRVRIHARLAQGMQAGQLPAGSRLPSARQLAREWGVARSTVDEAFAALQADGLIERRVGRGSFVAEHLPASTPAPAPLRREPNAATQRALTRLQPITDDPSEKPLHGQQGLRLRPQVTDVSRFPLPLWRRLIAAAYHESQRDRLSYGAAAGAFELRSAVAQHLALTRSLDCSPRQVIIVDSPLQAFGLVAQVLLEPGSPVCVAEPGHISTPRFFSVLHMQVHGIAPDAEGFDVQAAQRRVPRPALVVVQPISQYPLGMRMGAARREELLRWAEQTGAWILEHEFLAELSFDRVNPPPLLAQDTAESVLLSGSFNPITFPSLRLSYLVVPPRLAPAFAAVRGMLGDHSAVAPQMALAQFISEGHLAAHLRLLRELYGRRRQALLDALRLHPVLQAGARPMPGGVNLCVHLPPQLSDVALQAALLPYAVAPGTLSTHARQPEGLNGLVLGFGADEETAITGAVTRLAAVLDAAQAASRSGGVPPPTGSKAPRNA